MDVYRSSDRITIRTTDNNKHEDLNEDHFTLGSNSSISLPEFTQDAYPLQAMIYVTNKVFYDMGARNHALGIPEYKVIKEVMDNHGVDDWRTLQTVITQEQEQRALVEAITHVFTYIFWKERPPQDCVRNLILISFVESMYILGQQAFEYDHGDGSKTPHQIDLFSRRRFRWKFLSFFEANKEHLVLSKDNS